MTPPRPPNHAHVIRVLLNRIDDTSWLAHAIDCDLTCVADGRGAALDALVKMIEVQVAHDARLRREPLSAFAPAPQDRLAAFEQATSIAAPVELSRDERGATLRFLIANATERPSPAAPS